MMEKKTDVTILRLQSLKCGGWKEETEEDEAAATCS
jgi:hypothetical protein